MNGADKTDIDVAAILGLDEGRFAAYRVMVPDPHPRSRHLAIWGCSIIVLVLLAASGTSTLRINRASRDAVGSRHLGPSLESLGAYAFTLGPTAPLPRVPTQAAAAIMAPTKPQRPGSRHVHDVRVARADVGGRSHATEEARRIWPMATRMGGSPTAADRAVAEQAASSGSSSNFGRANLAQAGSRQSRRLERAERVEAIDAISLLRQK